MKLIQENIYTNFSCLYSQFLFYSFQYTDLWNSLLRYFDSFWLPFADRKTTGTNNFVSLIVKVTLLELVLSLSKPLECKTQSLFCLNFNSTFKNVK